MLIFFLKNIIIKKDFWKHVFFIGKPKIILKKIIFFQISVLKKDIHWICVRHWGQLNVPNLISILKIKKKKKTLIFFFF